MRYSRSFQLLYILVEQIIIRSARTAFFAQALLWVRIGIRAYHLHCCSEQFRIFNRYELDVPSLVVVIPIRCRQFFLDVLRDTLLPLPSSPESSVNSICRSSARARRRALVLIQGLRLRSKLTSPLRLEPSRTRCDLIGRQSRLRAAAGSRPRRCYRKFIKAFDLLVSSWYFLACENEFR